jgi:PAS domain S-box-containing protein
MADWQGLVSRDKWSIWIWIIAATTVFAFIMIFTGLLYGITLAIPHLLYIPVVIAAYMYPRRGFLFATIVGILYISLVVSMTGYDLLVSLEAVARAVVIIVIGWVVAWLSRRAREREILYKGLFDHSEAGALLIGDEPSDFTVLEANETAQRLIGTSSGRLAGIPLRSFWEDEAKCRHFIKRVISERKVEAFEAILRTDAGRKKTVLISAGLVANDRIILSFIDITSRLKAEDALRAANDKLNLLSAISVDHLHKNVDAVLEVVQEALSADIDISPRVFFEKIRNLAYTISRHLLLTESYRDLGNYPPAWHNVQELCRQLSATTPCPEGSLRAYAERLEIYADRLFPEVIGHILENAFRHGNPETRITVAYRTGPDGADLIIEDNGPGIADELKETIFNYDSGKHPGIGLFICRQVLEVTWMTIREKGTPGKGARFIIHIPEGCFRIATDRDGKDLSARPPHPPNESVLVREIVPSEFSLADTLWVPYHGMTGDPVLDRIFMVFDKGEAVSAARVRRHPDGWEMEGVYTPDAFRGYGYARKVCEELVAAARFETMYMFAVSHLSVFYGSLGFVPIPESQLPPTIRSRYSWAEGNMEGAMVCPMKREADPL